MKKNIHLLGITAFLTFSVTVGCVFHGEKSVKVICIVPKGYTGAILIAERPDYPSPRFQRPHYILPFSPSGYLQISRPSFEKLLSDTPFPQVVSARYSDETPIAVDPKSGFGLYGFAGQTGHRNDWYTFLFLGTKAEAHAFFDVPRGYPMQRKWLSQHDL